jgi:hypothetical protein
MQPVRVLDTRADGHPVAANGSITVPVDLGSGVNSHVRAFVVNITAVGPGAAGFLTAWSGQGAVPPSSTLNFTPGAVVPNLAIIPTAPCTASPSCAGRPAITIFNGSSSSTHVVVDLFGIFDDSTLSGGLRFHPITPTRIADSRIPQGVPHAIGGGQMVTVTAPDGVAPANTQALAVNLTAIAPTVNTFLTVWPNGLGKTRPTASNLNPARGQTVPNAVMTQVGPQHDFNVFNNAGTVNIAVDVVGYFGPGITVTVNAAGQLTLAPTPANTRARTLTATPQAPIPTAG